MKKKQSSVKLCPIPFNEKTGAPKWVSLCVLDHCTDQVLLNKWYCYIRIRYKFNKILLMFLLIVINIVNSWFNFKRFEETQLKLSYDIGFAYRRTDAQTDRHGETSIPPTTSLRGYKDPFHFWRFSLFPFQSYWTWYDGK
jgi:hypothetical protein